MYRILIIEDDKAIRDALLQAGEATGVATHPVESALIAKGKSDEAFRPGAYDAVVVGGYFHEAYVQNGHQIVERIRLRDRKVIIVGTAGDPRREADFTKAGATAFVVRGTQNRPAAGLLLAIELLEQRGTAKKRTKKHAEITPNQE